MIFYKFDSTGNIKKYESKQQLAKMPFKIGKRLVRNKSLMFFSMLSENRGSQNLSNG
jgi:hypothetical protein